MSLALVWVFVAYELVRVMRICTAMVQQPGRLAGLFRLVRVWRWCVLLVGG